MYTEEKELKDIPWNIKIFISGEWGLWVSFFLCLSVFSRFSVLKRNCLGKEKKLSYINSFFFFLALPALAMTLNIFDHCVWMLTWTVWEMKTNVSWPGELSSIGLCCCHLWFRLDVVGCLILWTHEHMNISTLPLPVKVLLLMWILSLTGPGVPWHSPGAQSIRASVDRLRTTRWKLTTPSLNITRHPAWQHLLE